eukprot:scaffold4463_cov51-Attheya_sp.AAC.18
MIGASKRVSQNNEPRRSARPIPYTCTSIPVLIEARGFNFKYLKPSVLGIDSRSTHSFATKSCSYCTVVPVLIRSRSKFQKRREESKIQTQNYDLESGSVMKIGYEPEFRMVKLWLVNIFFSDVFNRFNILIRESVNAKL